MLVDKRSDPVDPIPSADILAAALTQLGRLHYEGSSKNQENWRA